MANKPLDKLDLKAASPAVGAEIDRLRKELTAAETMLAQADAALEWVVRERRECHWPTGEMLANVRAAVDRHIARQKNREKPDPSR